MSDLGDASEVPSSRHDNFTANNHESDFVASPGHAAASDLLEVRALLELSNCEVQPGPKVAADLSSHTNQSEDQVSAVTHNNQRKEASDYFSQNTTASQNSSETQVAANSIIQSSPNNQTVDQVSPGFIDLCSTPVLSPISATLL